MLEVELIPSLVDNLVKLTVKITSSTKFRYIKIQVFKHFYLESLVETISLPNYINDIKNMYKNVSEETFELELFHMEHQTRRFVYFIAAQVSTSSSDFLDDIFGRFIVFEDKKLVTSKDNPYKLCTTTDFISLVAGPQMDGFLTQEYAYTLPPLRANFFTADPAWLVTRDLNVYITNSLSPFRSIDYTSLFKGREMDYYFKLILGLEIEKLFGRFILADSAILLTSNNYNYMVISPTIYDAMDYNSVFTSFYFNYVTKKFYGYIFPNLYGDFITSDNNLFLTSNGLVFSINCKSDLNDPPYTSVFSGVDIDNLIRKGLN